MKKVIIVLISIFIIPILVNAETLTYEICESGCEYISLENVSTAINNISDLSDKDIVINVNSDMNSHLDIGDFNNMANSVTINGNNHDFNDEFFQIFAKNIKIYGTNNLIAFFTFNSDHVIINNSNITRITFNYIDSNYQIRPEEIFLSDIFEIDETSRNKLISLMLDGNFKIENMNFKDNVLVPIEGAINIYNSQIGKVVNIPEVGNVTTNIYNSRFNSLKYVNITSEEDTPINEANMFYSSLFKNSSALNYDLYDIDLTNMGGQYKSTTTVYFDKETKLKLGDKLNLAEYLNYYIEDKEIDYTIEDESIAKIENKEIIGLKPGNTKVQVTTDEGHVIYNIDLTVYTISEKKVTMKAQNKLKLNTVFKDLDISSLSDDVWEISNPKVAKIVNGEIISLQKGETDIVAIINGVKYIYHLTVSDTLVSKDVKVPITGKSIKLWIVIVTAILLSVICICTYMLIKKRK